ncbi:hypothetical protein Q1695_002993 [Nippostrongylus brasiliensis]|nr:hypothetical protein Q1695_002993 [Nippostrongylus brasiliensis]
MSTEDTFQPGTRGGSSTGQGKGSGNRGWRAPAFNANAHPPTRYAERTNYATTYMKKRLFTSIFLPLLLFVLIVIASVIFVFRVISFLSRSQMYKAERGYGVVLAKRWYQVLRKASGPEVQNGRFMEFEYPNCGEEVVVSCWKEAKRDSLPEDMQPPDNVPAYQRKVFTFVSLNPEVVCPPSVFVGKHSPVKNGCRTPFD